MLQIGVADRHLRQVLNAAKEPSLRQTAQVEHHLYQVRTLGVVGQLGVERWGKNRQQLV
jgi:hypothetical protein